MREEPPQALVELLERLELATARQVRGMYGRVRRLARELPLFESAWVDALAQSRVLTPFQAAEINAGRGDALRVGPYVLCRPLPALGYADCYVAREIDSRQLVRLVVVPPPSGGAAELVGRLESLVTRSKPLASEHLSPITSAGADGDRVWAACRHVRGRTAAEWIVHNGRFPPQAVLEIARQMLLGLVALEEVGLCHGDLSGSALIVTEAGRVVLPQPGLRAIVRPEEGYAHADLSPEAYDYLAPERITGGGPPSPQSEVYACGCLWWHLLTGRVAVPGGSGLAKLRAAQMVEIFDVRQLAPSAPGPLAAAVSASVQRDPALRPQSVARLASELGPPTHAGKAALARCMTHPAGSRAGWPASTRQVRKSKQSVAWWAAVAGCLATAAAIAWSIREAAPPLPTANIPAGTQGANDAGGPATNRPGLGLTRESPGHVRQPVRLAMSRPRQGPGAELAPDVVGPPRGRQADRGGVPRREGNDLVLAAGGPLALASLELQPGQCVRGRPGARPLVTVPPGGLVVRPEGVRFEGIDFVWSGASVGAASGSGQTAIIRLEASRAEFRGCSFRWTGESGARPAAIRWVHPVDRSRLAMTLPSGQVRLSDCVLHDVGAGVACRTAGAVAVELANVLHLGGGPLVHLDHCPKPDEPVAIGLSQVTLRGGGPLLECRYERIEEKPGKVVIRSVRCAFVPGGELPLLSFTGPTSPQRLLDEVQWTGQGSLVSPDAVIAEWRQAGGRAEALDDASVSIAGLVRSAVEFAGAVEDGPAGSRITRWQVPLRSSSPPGIDPEAFTRPRGVSGQP